MTALSVIMPVYNQEKYVADAVRSILDQTYRDFEFIIVDDGSTDRTIEIVESFEDERIRLIRAPHEGFVKALGRATRDARGEWLARMDSDDICPPHRLARQMDFLAQHPECVLLTTAYGIITPNEKFLAPKNTADWQYVEPADITLGAIPFCDPATVFQRKLALETGYDDDIAVESPLWYKLLKTGKGAILREPLYFIRWRLGSLSRGLLKAEGNTSSFRARDKYDHPNLAAFDKPRRKIDVCRDELRKSARGSIANTTS